MLQPIRNYLPTIQAQNHTKNGLQLWSPVTKYTETKPNLSCHRNIPLNMPEIVVLVYPDTQKMTELRLFMC